MRKKFFFLAALLTATVFNLHAQVYYIDANGVEQSTQEATFLSDDCYNPKELTAGWYVVSDNITFYQGATCTGDVHLILSDGVKLTASGNGDYTYYAGIKVSGSGNSLTIYGQANQTGQLVAIGGEDCAGIGGDGDEERTGDNITINGGIITATGGAHAAGIGGGRYAIASNITINGGTITASGGGEYGCGLYGIGGQTQWGEMSSSNIKVKAGLVIKAGGNNPPTTKVATTRQSSDDITSALSGKRYVTIAPPAPPQVTGISISGYKIVNQQLTFSATYSDFSGTPNIVYSVKKGSGSYQTLSGATYTPTSAGTYTVKAVATYNTESATKEQNFVVRDQITYIDNNGVQQTCSLFHEVETSATAVTWDAGWYAVYNNNVTIPGITCNGAVHLILADGAKLTTTGATDKAGINVSGTNSLTIYGQTNQSGQLVATGIGGGAGIGGNTQQSGNNITINGGVITAYAGHPISSYSAGGAGIGGGADYTDGGCGIGQNITINGGTVNASSYSGSGIGGGIYSDGRNITINGGTITATNDGASAGIGGGSRANGHDITINGGIITATNYSNGAGIGGGDRGYNGSFGNAYNIYINGGKITAIGLLSSGIGAGFGGSASNIFANDTCLLLVDTSNPPKGIVIPASSTTDISSSLAGKPYAKVGPYVVFDQTGSKEVITAKKSKTTNVQIKRTFYKDGGNNTICLPFSLDAAAFAASPLNADCNKLQKFSSATIENAGKINETLVLTMEDVETKAIEAGVPYIIAWENTGDTIKNPFFFDVTISKDEASESTSNKVKFVGTFVPKAVEKDDKGIMFVGIGGKLNWPNVGGNINGFRAYFALDLGADSRLRQGMDAMLVDGKATGIESLTEGISQEKVKKLIQAGRVIIISDGVKYDLNGRILK